jgi:hypothetical protein
MGGVVDKADLHHLYLRLRKCRQFGAYADSFGMGPFLLIFDHRSFLEVLWLSRTNPDTPMC